MDTIPYWKNIYQSISGQSENVTAHDVIDLLNDVEKNLHIGILQFGPFTETSFEEWKAGSFLEDIQKDLEVLVKRISRTLNLDTKTAWALICNYLMFEYYGKVEDLQEVIRYEVYTKALMDKIWHFYTTERLFAIKSLRYVLEHSKDKEHRLYPVYQSFLKNNNISQIRAGLFKQISALIQEVNGALYNTTDKTQEWIDRTYQEQLELVLTILVSIDADDIPMDQIIDMLKTFKEHGFSDYSGSFTVSNPDILRTIKLMEFGCFLLAMRQFWAVDNFSEHIEDVERELQHENYPVITLIWCVVVTTLEYETAQQDLFEKKYQYWISAAMMRSGFEIIAHIVSLPILKTTRMENTLKCAAYDFLAQASSTFDTSGHLYSKRGTINLMREILTIPKLVHMVLDIKKPLYSIYHSSRMLFPEDFCAFTMLSSEILDNPEYVDQLFNVLLDMDVYTMAYRGEMGELADIFKIVAEIRPIGTQNIVIPEMSIARVIRLSDRVYLKFRKVEYNYFYVLEAKLNIILNGSFKGIDPFLLATCHDALLGLTFLVKLIKVRPTILQSPYLKATINYIKYLSTNCSYEELHLSKLNGKALELCNAMMPTLHVEIMQSLCTSGTLPILDKEKIDLKYLFKKNVIGDYKLLKMIYHESSLPTHELFYAYLDFIKTALDKGWYCRRIQIPGMIFLLHNVFPTHIHWVYSDEHENNHITYKILKILMDTMQIRNKELSEHEQLLYDFCIETFYNYEGFVKSFINVLRTSNNTLEQIMCKETNWKTGKLTEYVSTVKTCITIVLLALNCKTKEQIKETVFWKYFLYSGPNYSSIIKIITDYINHKFNSELCMLATILLKKIAEDSSVPLMAHLEMDNYQVQCMFLERLRDPIENDDIKINLLSLITTCVKTQPGMTAAFFNLTFRKRMFKSHKETETMGDSATEYMAEYLANIEKSPAYYQLPLQSSVLELFHTIWLEKKTSLISTIMESGKFWTTITTPICQEEYTLHDKTYAQILGIMAVEVSKRTQSESLETTLKLLLADSSKFCAEFPRHIAKRLRSNVLDESSLDLLNAWKMFLVFVIKSKLDVFSANCKSRLITSTLEGLLANLKVPKDVKIVGSWSQIYLCLISKWDSKTYENVSNFQLLAETMKYAAMYYHDIGPDCQLSIATISMKSVANFNTILSEESEIVEKFLITMGIIISKEFDTLSTRNIELDAPCADNIPLSMLILFGKELAIRTGDTHRRWFYLTHYLEKTMVAITYFIRCRRSLTLAKICTNCLIICAKSPIGSQFLLINMEMFFYNSYPKDYMDISSFAFGSGQAWYFEDFWIFYSLIINLNIVLLDTFGYAMFKTILGFLHFHKDAILSAMQLPQVVAEDSALILTSKSMLLIHKMLMWKAEWFRTEEVLFVTFFKGITESLNFCLNICMRPRILKYFIFDKNCKLRLLEDIPLHVITSIMNRLTDIVNAACLCYIEVSPHLLDALAGNNYRRRYLINMDYSFKIPPVTTDGFISTGFTMGGILWLAQFLCKAEIQINIDARASVKRPVVQHEPPKFTHILYEEPKDKMVTNLTFVNTDFLSTYSGVAGQFNTPPRQFNVQDNYSLQSQWCAQMDKERVESAMETIHTLIASQMFKALHECHSNTKELTLLKRDFSSEMQYFHDFIRKRTSSQHKLCLKHKHCRGDSSICVDKDYMMACFHWYTVICQIGT